MGSNIRLMVILRLLYGPLLRWSCLIFSLHYRYRITRSFNLPLSMPSSIEGWLPSPDTLLCFSQTFEACGIWSHSRKFFNQEFLFLPKPLLPSMLPFFMSYNNAYFSFRKIWLGYAAFRFSTVASNSISLYILLNTGNFVSPRYS